MKTKDKIKEEIGFYKLLMTITSAIASSLVGWLFNNLGVVLSAKIIFVFTGMMIFLFITIFFLIAIKTKIEELSYE